MNGRSFNNNANYTNGITPIHSPFSKQTAGTLSKTSMADSAFSTPDGRRKERFDKEASTETLLESLTAKRALERKQYEHSQSINPRPFIGTCQEMCSEYERVEREAHFDVSEFERSDRGNIITSTGHAKAAIDHAKAVKKYHRPAAGNEAPLPSDVRPPPVLKTTMDYLLDCVVGGGAGAASKPFTLIHKFVRDRTRAIRQDMTLQQQAIKNNPEWWSLCIQLHEQMARFHILSGFILCEESPTDFDAFQNTEQLRKVLQSLQEHYGDVKREEGRLAEHLTLTQNQAEFQAYSCLAHIQDKSILWDTQSLPISLHSLAPIKMALQACIAFHQTDFQAYRRALVNGPLLQSALLAVSLNVFRRSCLSVIQKAFQRDSIRLHTLAKWLIFDCDDVDIEGLKKFLKPFSIQTSDGDAAIVNLQTFSQNDPSTTPKPSKVRCIEDRIRKSSLTVLIRSEAGARTDENLAAPSGKGSRTNYSINGAFATSSTKTTEKRPEATQRPPQIKTPIPNRQEMTARLAQEMYSSLLYHTLSPAISQISAETHKAASLQRIGYKQSIIQATAHSLYTEMLQECTKEAIIQAHKHYTETTKWKAKEKSRFIDLLSHFLFNEMIGGVLEGYFVEQIVVDRLRSPLESPHLSLRISRPPSAPFLKPKQEKFGPTFTNKLKQNQQSKYNKQL